MRDDWITINKSVLDLGRYESWNVFRVFLYFLTHAAQEPTYDRGVRLERGQLIVTRSEVCERTGLTAREYRTGIAKLLNDQQTTSKRPAIDQQTTSKFTIITICDFGSYVYLFDDKRPANDQQTTSDRPANDQQSNQQAPNPPNGPENPTNIPKEEEREKERFSPTPPYKEKEKEKEKALPHKSLNREKVNPKSKILVKEKETLETFSSDGSIEPPEDQNKKVEGELQRKQKNMRVRMENFYNSLVPYLQMYSKEIIRGFFDYWSEPNKSQTLMRFELERTWSLGRRLATWERKKREYEQRRPKTISEEKREADAAVIERLRVDTLRRLSQMDNEESIPI